VNLRPSARFPWRLATIGFLAGTFVVFVLGVYRFGNTFQDDAFITYRFAQHLSNGHGLTWNIGGERVEGYTSFLHVALLVPFVWLDVSPLAASILIAIASVAGSATLIGLFLRRRFGRIYPQAAFLISVFLLDQTTAALAANGLETQLFAFMCCATFVAADACLDTPHDGAGLVFGVLAFLSVLARPEAVVYTGALFVVLAIGTQANPAGRIAGRTALRRIGLGVGLFVLLGLTYALLKYLYFGYLLPNPFYLKSNRFGLFGAEFVVDYLRHVSNLLLPAALVSLFITPRQVWVRCLKDPVIRSRIALCVVPIVVALAYYSTIIHEVGEDHRFSYPTYFAFIIATAALASAAARANVTARRWRTAAGSVACLAPLFYVQGIDGMRFSEPFPLHAYHVAEFELAETLRATGLGPSATVIHDSAGVVPFFSGFNHIDRVGLADNYLSGRHPVSPEAREDYLWSRNADVYIGQEPPAGSGAQSSGDDPVMASGYVTKTLLDLPDDDEEEDAEDDDDPDPVDDRIMLKRRPDLLYARMCILRDGWAWIGELEWPGSEWGWRRFAYVRRDSPHRHALEAALDSVVKRQAKEVSIQ
jgi:arabinofuranosyltransferase